MTRIANYFKSLLLVELLAGMKLTLGYLFAPKYTLNYPYEKTPQSPRFSKWYSWMCVSTIESTGQLSSQKPQ